MLIGCKRETAIPSFSMQPVERGGLIENWKTKEGIWRMGGRRRGEESFYC
jgi:hypothetical protein